MSEDNLNYSCPTCGRLASLPWDAVWCTHFSSNFIPHPPEWIDADWTRMLPVESIVTGGLPEGHDSWVVVETRNPYGYPNNEISGEDKRHSRVVATDLTQHEATVEAMRRQRLVKDVKPHIDSFRPYPLDLCQKEWF